MMPHPDEPAASQPTTDEPATSQPSALLDVVNTLCLVSGKAVAAEAGTYSHDGKTYGFCCKDCIDEFKKDPAKFAAKI